MRQEPKFEAPASRAAWLLPLVLVGLGILGWACQDGTPGSGSGDAAGMNDALGNGEVSRRDVLDSITNNVLVPSTADFASTAASLQTAVEAYAAAAMADPTTADGALEAAQQAWREAMTQWQMLELMQVGPAAPALVGVGGEDLRDAIYSWPTADSCGVDRSLVEQHYLADDFYVQQFVWAYGLDALEYLLFDRSTEHTCPSQVQLDGPWSALSPEELDRRRAQYAAVIAAGVATQATALASRWSPDGDNFAAMLASAGQDGSPYESAVQGLDEVFRAMFYIDKQTKDGKLGLPLGLVDGCPSPPCGDLMEQPWSGMSASSIVVNLQALRLMVQGGPDPETAIGFDDLLAGIGERTLADSLLSQITTAIEIAESFDEPLQQVIAADSTRITQLHGAVKGVTDILKGPFVMALMLTIPAEGAGDND